MIEHRTLYQILLYILLEQIPGKMFKPFEKLNWNVECEFVWLTH
jgi:hypothetical protein